jgi:hypothetical protein
MWSFLIKWINTFKFQALSIISPSSGTLTLPSKAGWGSTRWSLEGEG